MAGWKSIALIVFLCAVTEAGAGQQQQIDLIKNTASDVCDTVKQARGRSTVVDIQGEVATKLSGLAGKFIDLGGAVSARRTKEEFEGLSREATAIALQGDRECRERPFTLMFDNIFQSSVGTPPRTSDPNFLTNTRIALRAGLPISEIEKAIDAISQLRARINVNKDDDLLQQFADILTEYIKNNIQNRKTEVKYFIFIR